MNRIYEIQEGRPFWKLRPLMIVITLAAVILAGLVAIGLVVSGPVARAIGDAIGLGDTAVTIWSIAKWPVLLGLAAVVVAILYYATPNVQQPKFKWISLGAVVAIITWVVASALFGLYVSQFSNYNKTYGSLAGVIIFLLWLWITNLASALRRRAQRRNGTRPTTSGRDPRRGRHSIATPRHQGHREERGQGRSGYRAGPATQKQPWGHFRTGRVLTEN